MQVQREQSNEEIIAALQRQITELKASNLALKEQLERREQFNAMVAHELRGPLTPIINYAELLTRPNLKPEAVARSSASGERVSPAASSCSIAPPAISPRWPARWWSNSAR